MVELSAVAGVVELGVPVKAGDANNAPPAPDMSEPCNVTAPVRELNAVTGVPMAA